MENFLKPPFSRFFWVKTALAIAPRGLDTQNVKLGKGKHPCFFSFLIVSVLFLSVFVTFTRVFDTFLHLVKLWITPVSRPTGRLKLNILSVQPEGLRRNSLGQRPVVTVPGRPFHRLIYPFSLKG